MESMENGFLYVSLMEGAPGSYYLVFLLPGAGNLIFYTPLFSFFILFFFFLTFSAGLGNQPSMSGVDEG